MELKFIAIAIVMGLAAFGSALANARVVSKAIESMTRQPELKGSIMSTMFIGIGMIEAIPLLGVIVGFLMLFVY
ncbi:F0F1 ATP synthase subunit C [Granulicatella sp. zg-ZJ]|uniref:F0F1 ATP synthase subunit C n=1 Tax=unclassified Granulicatella TaxID=2630493 RepID=UPI0013BFBDD7|nr:MULTISPECIES: F0F1 ATP synthase subunit C [unclassified Granulicatella]MBS4749983.1 F0F1 ATP synthase subunit C [Carnobacteriaceae bacterium zg-ZUI78]NEW63093.1 F0F1 ATP synthase subunit C [Granulicatella sp. zg-ZJ]NEW66181.1 F0F1 ATP synthase subunit C [Granulicatella sp. zg-84]QMI86062.1 F0F1 ATP synthase subunit C [Carnobacteriaceae bacterium zg-84]